MNRSELIKLYERLYFHELDRRDKISARQATPLGAMVGLVAIVAFLLNNKPNFSTQYLAASFWLLLAAAVICLVIGGWHFRNSWLAHGERHVATAAEIDNYFDKLEAHYSDQPNVSDLVDREFSQFLLDTYRRSATTNAQMCIRDRCRPSWPAPQHVVPRKHYRGRHPRHAGTPVPVSYTHLDVYKRQVYDWLQSGAHFYVCGAIGMGKDVHATLLQIVSEQASVDAEGAAEYLSNCLLYTSR